MDSGIYMICNRKNRHKYIGQTKQLSKRWIQHRCALRRNAHPCEKLQKAWNKYGEENFEYSVIEHIDISLLNEREIYWIDYYNSAKLGYNISEGGSGCSGFKHRSEEIEKMRSIQNPDIILQFDLDHNIIKEWIGGVSHIKKELGYTKECVSLRCKHTISQMSPYKNSYWVFKEEYNNPKFTWEGYMENLSLFNYKKTNSRKRRKICQYSINRELIKKWDTLSDVRKEYIHTSSISSVLNRSRGKRSAYGYIWAYEDYDFSDGYFDVLIHYQNKANENRKKKIAKVSYETKEIISIYESVTSAAQAHNTNSSNICTAAKGYPNHKSCGFLWKYI